MWLVPPAWPSLPTEIAAAEATGRYQLPAPTESGRVHSQRAEISWKISPHPANCSCHDCAVCTTSLASSYHCLPTVREHSSTIVRSQIPRSFKKPEEGISSCVPRQHSFVSVSALPVSTACCRPLLRRHPLSRKRRRAPPLRALRGSLLPRVLRKKLQRRELLSAPLIKTPARRKIQRSCRLRKSWKALRPAVVSLTMTIHLPTSLG